jgi:hypothetical protein
MQTITTIGLNIAKSVFQVHGIDAEGDPPDISILFFHRQLRRIDRQTPFANNFSARFVIFHRCTSARHIGNKTISKWSRALWYVARCKKPNARLREFVKGLGGVNACADRYAKHFGRGHRR